MRKKLKLPRILKINWIRDLSISVTFNNGESRIIDFAKVLNNIGVKKESVARILYDRNEFAGVSIQNNTLSWANVRKCIEARDGKKIYVPFEIGADVLYGYSRPEEVKTKHSIGRLIREARIKKRLTQKELAEKSGTTRSYISRIENGHSGIELDTLRKIVETGLGQHLELIIR